MNLQVESRGKDSSVFVSLLEEELRGLISPPNSFVCPPFLQNIVVLPSIPCVFPWADVVIMSLQYSSNNLVWEVSAIRHPISVTTGLCGFSKTTAQSAVTQTYRSADSVYSSP